MIDYKKITKKYEQEVISSLTKWIQIDSTYDEKTISLNAPFGKGVKDALDYIADLALSKGFNVDRCDGYCVEISYGEGDLISIYAHADVVPVSGTWTHPPFSGIIDNNKMYGRGTSDDKGPAMSAFYALCALKDEGLINGYKVNLVIGGNEESGSKCLEYYFHTLNKPYPKYGFTPDGEFPLIYGEKGIANYKVELDVDYKNVLEIKGGVVANSVIDEAYALVVANSNINEEAKIYFSTSEATYKIENVKEDVFKITVFGKAAHGSLPKEGVNAALELMHFLSKYFNEPSLDVVPSYYFDADGTKLGSFYKSELLHETTYNVGLLSYENKKLTYVVNFRYPEIVKVNEVIERLNSLNIGKHTLLSESEPLLIDPNSPMVKTLHNVYKQETGDVITPIMTIGGGTYAKESKNTLAFGSHFPNRDDRIHNNDETITIDDLISSMSIYANAIDSLGKLK